MVLAVRVHSLDTAHRLTFQAGEQLRGRRASSILAAVTRTAISKPMLSTTIWRFLPSTSWALSGPAARRPRWCSTDWLSTLAEVRGE